MVCPLYEAQLEILTSISLFTSPTPNSMPKPESTTSLVFLLFTDTPVWISFNRHNV